MVAAALQDELGNSKRMIVKPMLQSMAFTMMLDYTLSWMRLGALRSARMLASVARGRWRWWRGPSSLLLGRLHWLRLRLRLRLVLTLVVMSPHPSRLSESGRLLLRLGLLLGRRSLR